MPAEFTILNFPVDDIAAAAKGLADRGITFERYGDGHDEQGVFRAAWTADRLVQGPGGQRALDHRGMSGQLLGIGSSYCPRRPL